jgi:hypothetical protein
MNNETAAIRKEQKIANQNSSDRGRCTRSYARSEASLHGVTVTDEIRRFFHRTYHNRFRENSTENFQNIHGFRTK